MAKMITKTTIWTFDERESKWYGVCIECKGEKAKYTPQMLKDSDIKPCNTCSNIEEYNRCAKRISQKEEPVAKANQAEHDKANARKQLEPLDIHMNRLKVGDKVKFCSACYQDRPEKYHAEILEITKYDFKPEHPSTDSYSEKAITRYLAKVKDVIINETCTVLADDLEKVS